MKITIVGGGNIGTQFMVHCAEKGHMVTAYTSTPELFEKHLTIVDENMKITHEGDIFTATNNPVEAFDDAELIIVTLPAMMMKEIANTIYWSCSGKWWQRMCFFKMYRKRESFFRD